LVDNRTLTIEKSDGVILCPVIHPKLSDFCTKLTTITQDMVDKGPTLSSFLPKFTEFGDITWASWGDYDRNQLTRECSIKRLKYPFGNRHINLKNVFSVLTCQSKELDLSSALKYLGLSFDGTPHRGVDDARNIAKIYIEIVDKIRQIR
jgi:inhibitor of KinA sporulation pathway (predicted exonuclease)